MSELSKSQKKHLRALAQRAYETELSLALNDLHKKFQRWQTKEISPWELTDDIHEFHNGTARDLYKFYEMGSNAIISVAHAVAKGILAIEDVEASCRPLIQPKTDYFRDNC